MNDMELLWELGQETGLPAPAELDAARARLAAAIAAAPATASPATASPATASPATASPATASPATASPATEPEAATVQPGPSGGLPAGPLRPSAPAPVLTAVRLLHAGAVGTAVYLIITLAFIGDTQSYHLRYLGHSLTTAQLSHQRPLIITLVIVAGLALIALWLSMARAVRQGRTGSRILSTVLLGLATLELTGNHGVAQVFCAAATWLTGLAAVWLLWRPASSAFFRQCRQAALTRRR